MSPLSLQLHIRVGIKIPAGGISGEVLVIALAAYHRGIVSAKLERRNEQLAARFFRSCLEVCADTRIRRHSAGYGYLFIAELPSRHHGARN